MNIQVDTKLIDELHQDFSAEKCICALFTCAATLAASIGVKVNWDIAPVNDTTVDQKAFRGEFGKLAAITGALAAGARFNPIQYAKDRDHAAKNHRQTPHNFSSGKENDPQGEGGKSR